MSDTATIDPVLREQVVETICDLLPRVLKREVAGASETTTLMDDLGMSSTTGLELVLELEDRLEREISVEDLGRDNFETVGTLADYVAGNLLPEEE
ncbi:phosphopantetheine-binding protein [Dactylosporangium sp. AC04546]|uniref:acyl carrier protein n=1 Tax=Dactylosporangium sp. AC04546 TaxID=2862460 RepID=UPI001EE01295|nr:phosphopantetheine-binding protein [Dactylosporangium sp. AC04546]WVK86186.1 phosphopantetheine-binding protein [Dactylosporangium sp. AC04546]